MGRIRTWTYVEIGMTVMYHEKAFDEVLAHDDDHNLDINDLFRRG